jgi:hypothetical protein
VGVMNKKFAEGVKRFKYDYQGTKRERLLHP